MRPVKLAYQNLSFRDLLGSQEGMEGTKELKYKMSTQEGEICTA